MIVGTLGITPNASTVTRFSDLGDPDSNGYPHRFVQTAYDNGITYGTNAAQTLFAPYNPIHRDQVISMIVRGANNLYPGSLVSPPIGFDSLFDGIPEPHGGNLRIAEYNGLLHGLIGLGPSWNVSANATRGEVAQMLYNLLGLLTPSGVWVYADGSGDYPTIEAAVANIDTGETIHLGPGVFHLQEDLWVNFSFNLIGSGMSGANMATVVYPGDVIGVGPVTFKASDISFVNSASFGSSDVMYVNGGTVSLSRCSFTGGHYGNQYGNGLNAYGSSQVTAVDCVFTQNDKDGVEAAGSAEVSLTRCTMEENGQNGVGLYDNGWATIDQSLCVNNSLHGIGCNDHSAVIVRSSECSHNGAPGYILASGIYLEEAASGTIQNTLCTYNLVDGISCHDEASLQIEHSTCNNNGEDGITFSEYVTGTVTYCECSNNVGYDGIDVHDDAYGQIDHNLCVGNNEAGIWFGDNAGGIITNNECANNYYGILIDLSSNPVVGAGNFLHNNVVNFKNDMMWATAADSLAARAH
jgi:parallel beta-helix repeat protein